MSTPSQTAALELVSIDRLDGDRHHLRVRHRSTHMDRLAPISIEELASYSTSRAVVEQTLGGGPMFTVEEIEALPPEERDSAWRAYLAANHGVELVELEEADA